MRSLYLIMIAALFLFALCPVAMAQDRPLNEYDSVDLMAPELNHAHLYIGACETFMSMAKKEELLGIFRSEQADRVNKFYKLMCVEARWPDHIIADCESYLKLEPKGRYVSRASQLIKLIKSTDFTVLGVKPMTEGDRQAIRQSYLSILHKSVSSSLAVLADTEKNLTDLDRKSLIELRAHLRWALTDKLIAQEEYDYLAAKLIEQNLP